MSELEKLKKKHRKEIQELQDNCPHTENSDWVEYWWAPGHPWGYVKYCLRCGKEMERKEPELTSTYGNEDWEKINITISHGLRQTAKEEEK